MIFFHQKATLALNVRLSKAAVVWQIKESRVLNKLSVFVTVSHGNRPNGNLRMGGYL
jgi:AMMECR1 domain-containing protein